MLMTSRWEVVKHRRFSDEKIAEIEQVARMVKDGLLTPEEGEDILARLAQAATESAGAEPRCFVCAGPWSAPTGHVFSVDVRNPLAATAAPGASQGAPGGAPAPGAALAPLRVEHVFYCGRCAREFYAFFRGRMISMSSSRASRPDFAAAAATSIRPPLPGDPA
jgi:hypothetical protein